MDYSYLSLFLVVAACFLATNLDNLVLLTLLQSSRQRWQRQTALGYAIASAVVVGLALTVALAGGNLDGNYVGFLGIVPAAMGLKILASKRRKPQSLNNVPQERALDSGLNALSASALLMLGNSGDSLALLLPLFLDAQPQYYLFVSLCYALFVMLWLAISCKIAANVSTAERAIHWAEKFAPWMMVGVGVYIFMDTAADTIL